MRKVFVWRCIAPGLRAGHVLGQQHCNSFAQSTHARAWLAHGAHASFIDEKGLIVYPIISLRQLPPRLVRVPGVNYSHTVIRVHTMFMCVLVYYVYIIFLAPSRLNRRASFHPPQRQEHIQDVIESTTGPTSKWCKDVAKLLKCPLAQVGRVSQHLISPINRGFNGELYIQMVIYSFLDV